MTYLISCIELALRLDNTADARLVYNEINQLLLDTSYSMYYTVTIAEKLHAKPQSLAESRSQSVDEMIRVLSTESLDQPCLVLSQW